MKREIEANPDRINLLLLTWIAGTLDGLSYLRSHVFTANMTGNLVLLGIRVVQRDMANAARLLIALVAFAVGCILAALLISKREEQSACLLTTGFATELIFLLVFAALFYLNQGSESFRDHCTLISVAAIALAVQSVTVRRLKVSGVVTTFITGTITTSMVGLVRIVLRQPAPPHSEEREETHVALLLGMLAVYFVAVITATLLIPKLSGAVAISPTLLLAVVLWRTRKLKYAAIDRGV